MIDDDEDLTPLAKAQLTKSEEIIAKMINPSGNYSYKEQVQVHLLVVVDMLIGLG